MEKVVRNILSCTCSSAWTCSCARERKSSVRAAALRQIGNIFFAQKTTEGCLNALKNYNLSICFAEEGSKDISIGYANRSAAYFELKLYDVCLKNIAWARSSGGYPDILMEKLNKREAKCKEQIATQTKAKEPLVPELSFPPHKSVPFIADCLELRKNKRYGRYVITNRDLMVGQIIAIEEPFCTSLMLKQHYERCENCLMECSLSLIPCKLCTCVMFCSENCRKEAMDRFHKYECPVIDFIDSELESGNQRLALRTTLCALSTFKTLENFRAFTEEADEQDNNVFVVNKTVVAGPCQKYAPVFSIQTAAKNKNANKEISAIERVIMALLLLSEVPELSLRVKTVEFLVKVTEKHNLAAQISPCGLDDMSVLMKELFECAGTMDKPMGMYPFRFLLNHSCVPNTISTTFGNKIVITVSMPVKAGEQLFDCYENMHHGKYALVKRRANLPFNCACTACENDYPASKDLRFERDPCSIILMSDCLNNVFRCDRNAAFALIDRVCMYLQHHPNYPAAQLVLFGEYIRHIYELIYGKEIPLSARFSASLYEGMKFPFLKLYIEKV